METTEKKLYTLLVYSENIAGILNQITAVFTRRQVNIESLNVSASSIEGVHKYTITAWSDEDQIIKITKQIEKKIDGFHISVTGGQVTVVGANGRGTAYGLLEMSRMAGVSPWIWWGDVAPEKKSRLTIDSGFKTLQGASVEYRGIFLNDEDWTTRPWSYGTFEKAAFGEIGPKTYKKIFQLLMRLRANAI